MENVADENGKTAKKRKKIKYSNVPLEDDHKT